MDKHLAYMRRAFELAENARGRCSPNPFVGAVIVKDGRIIGEGWTQAYGSDHAEVQALKNCPAGCAGAAMYVTLEPCSHFGKNPPCANAIIESGIGEVYIGIQDPNPLVCGQGIRLLREAGILVQSGLLADQITRQLEYHITYVTQNRPFVILKSAVSLDARVSASDGSSRWISCEESRQRTHELRREADAVITGSGTVLKDDPLLNVRLPDPYKQPLRVVLDSRGRIPLTSQIARTAKDYKTLVFTSPGWNDAKQEAALAALGIEFCRIPAPTGQLDLSQALAELHRRRISVVLLEAGPTLNTAFLRARLVDKLIVFIAPKLLGGNQLAWQDLGIANIGQALNLKDMEICPSGCDLQLSGYPDYPKSGPDI